MRRLKEHPGVVLGVDVGTQSAKCVVLDAGGELRGVGQAGYPLLTPRPQWAEQDPDDWWEGVVNAVRQALQTAAVEPLQVQAIGLTGQMHGVVILGADHRPLRPAIIWMDRRSANLCATVQARVGPDAIRQVAGNRLSPGFAGASLAWLREVEPQLLDQARAALQPKDTIVLRLTGQLSTEPSDAAATWLFDIRRGAWSDTLAAACGINTEILPPVHPSASVVGELRADAAEALGLRAGIPVVAGAGDQAGLLLGSGVVEAGRGSITLGTGGQMTVVSGTPRVDPSLRLNTFCHAVPDRWYTMGAILNGGIALRWWREVVTGQAGIPYDTLLEQAAQVAPGADGLIFLPYLEGERTPHMDPGAFGAFVGLSLRHTQAHLTRAVLEGIAFAFRDCALALAEAGPVPDHFLIGGGGSQGAVWRQIIASVLGISLQTVAGREHTAVGAAMLAGIGAQMYFDVDQAVALAVRTSPAERAFPADHEVYRRQHARYRALYPALRKL